MVPVPRVQPDATLIEENPAKHFFVIGFKAHAQAGQIIRRGQIRQTHYPRIFIARLAELIHEHIDVDGNTATGFQILQYLHNEQKSFARPKFPCDDINGHV
ncbi:hypothetical protein D9M70_477540 [compost metagenome]